MSSGRERRHHYRAGQSPSDPIEAAIHLPTGEVLATEFRDLSGSGASVSVLLECSHLDDGDVIELEVWAPGRHRVRTPAKVVFTEQDGDRLVRYGFRFINRGNLYAQLDEFYAKLFNRRRSVRGPAELDRRTPVHLSWPGHYLEVLINELSAGGMSLLLSREQALLLERIEEVELSFDLPGCGTMTGTAHIRHHTPLASRVLLGLAFELDSPVGFSRHRTELSEYLRERDLEIQSWASSWV